jgi:hypothetical protein
MAAYDEGRTLQIGGGLLFYENKSTSGYDKQVYFGPTESITISVENEFVEHKSTEGCVSLVDKKISIGKTANIQIGTTTINPSSLARAFQGDITQNPQAAVTDEPVVTEAVTLGAVTDYGYMAATSVVVMDDTDTTTYVEGTDYELISKPGYIIPIPGGGITDGDILHLTVTAPAFEGVIVSAMKFDQLEGRFTLITNSNTGNNYKYVFQNVNVTQSGDFALKGGEEFALLEYEGAITIDSETAASSLSQFFDVYTLPGNACDTAAVH